MNEQQRNLTGGAVIVDDAPTLAAATQPIKVTSDWDLGELEKGKPHRLEVNSDKATVEVWKDGVRIEPPFPWADVTKFDALNTDSNKKVFGTLAKDHLVIQGTDKMPKRPRVYVYDLKDAGKIHEITLHVKGKPEKWVKGELILKLVLPNNLV